MKQHRLHIITLILCLFMVTISSSSCLRKRQDYGNILVRNIPIKAFDGLNITGNATVDIVQGKDYKVEVKAPEKVMNLINVNEKNSTLSVNVEKFSVKNVFMFDKKQNPTSRINILVTVPLLKKIAVSNNADLYVKQMLTVDSLDINVSDNASCDMEKLSAKMVRGSIIDNGNADFPHFNVAASTFHISGNASLDIKYIDAKTSEVTASGNASADLSGQVKEGVKTSASGNGSISNQVTASRNK